MNAQNSSFPIPPGVDHPWPPATEAEIREIERAKRVSLPDDYRDFLLAVNGIECAGKGVHVPVMFFRKELQLHEVWSIFTTNKNAEKVCQVLEMQTAYKFDKRVPTRFLLIGFTSGMECYCISLAEHDRGHVYFWQTPDDEVWAEATEAGYDAEYWLFPIADSFREFWSKLRVEKEGESE